MSTTPQVWLVTGCSSGFGAEFIRNVLKRGDKAIATGRNLAALEPLAKLGAATLQLDVSASYDDLAAVTKKAIAIYGHVDVLVNNAGYAQTGAMEDVSADLLQKQFQTLVFGPVNLTRALLPHFREQQRGTILVVSSIAGSVVGAGMGSYTAAKAALDSLFGSLALELASTPIKVLVAQPGEFRTDIISAEKLERDMPPTTLHTDLIAGLTKHLLEVGGKQKGDPAKFVDLLVEMVSTGKYDGKDMPAKLLLGADAFSWATKTFKDNTAWAEEWESVSKSTDFPA